MTEAEILNIFSRDSNIVIPKILIKRLGIYGAIMLSEILFLYRQAVKTKNITEDNYFILSYEYLEEQTTLSRYQQNEGLKLMDELEIIQTDLRGIPAKKYCNLVLKNFKNLFETPRINSISNNNNINKEEDNCEAFKPSVENFLKLEDDLLFHDLKQVKTIFSKSGITFDYCLKKMGKEADLGIDLEFYFHSVKDWSDTKTSIKRNPNGWIATIRQFIRSDVQGRKVKMLTGESQDALSYLKL